MTEHFKYSCDITNAHATALSATDRLIDEFLRNWHVKMRLPRRMEYREALVKLMSDATADLRATLDAEREVLRKQLHSIVLAASKQIPMEGLKEIARRAIGDVDEPSDTKQPKDDLARIKGA
jgi:hypothetical protein